MICPVMKCGAVAKNKTAAAMSFPVPLRRMGVCLAIRRMNAAAAFSPRSIIPGATQLFEEPGTLEQSAKAASNWFTAHGGQ